MSQHHQLWTKLTLTSVVITIRSIRIGTAVITLLITSAIMLPLQAQHTSQGSKTCTNSEQFVELALLLFAAGRFGARPSSIRSAAGVCCSSCAAVGCVVVGFDDFGAFGTSVLLAAEDCDPEGSGAAEEAEKGKQDEAGDNTNHNSSDGTS